MFSVATGRAVILRVAVIVSICMVALAACIPADYYAPISPLPTPPRRVPGEEVPFTSFWQGRDNQPCEGWTEVASLVTTEEEYTGIVALIEPYDINGLTSWEGLDLGADEAVIYVYLGCTPGREEDINTKSIVKTGEHALSILAEYGLMVPDKAGTADSKSHGQLLRIPWDGTPASETQLSLVLYPVYR